MKKIKDNGIVVYGDFEGASLADIRSAGKDSFVVDCLEEDGVPDMAFNRVFYDYTFACGIRNETDEVRSITIRLNLCERSGKRNLHFMQGPYWVREGQSWRNLPPSVHRKGEYWVETLLEVPAGARLVLATKPFLTEQDLERVLETYEERLEFVSHRSAGKTAEGRDIMVVETPPRDQVVMVTSSLQSAEFAAGAILSWLDWLSMDSLRTQKLLEHFQFCLFPETMPDGVAHGLSIMNTKGQCPMFGYKAAFDGSDEAPEETAAIAHLAREKKPVLWMDVHIHPGRYNVPKLCWIRPEFYKDEKSARRSEILREQVHALFPDWRDVLLPLLDRPDFSLREHGQVLAAENLGTTGLVLQSYAHTEAGKNTMFCQCLEAALEPLL